MGSAELTVLVVDDDFRVANMHAGIVNALPGFTVTRTATTLAAARKADPVDLALVDVYLPDGSGVDFVRELRCDSMVLSAATDAPTIRAAIAAGALSYIVNRSPPLIWPPGSGATRAIARSWPAPTSPARRWTLRWTPCARASRRPNPLPRSPRRRRTLCCRRFTHRVSRCRRPRFLRRSVFRGPPRSGICRRWPIPAMSRSSSATARPVGPNRNSWR